jgi:hypothetical protein
MLKNITILWLVFAAVMGFAVGGTFVSALLIPQTTIEQKSSRADQSAANQKSIEERHQATEEAIAYYTKWSMFLTAVLASTTVALCISTTGLYLAGEKQIGINKEIADANLRQANIVMAVESPIPLIVAGKLAQYSEIPGEIVIFEQLPPGPIPPNCRILIAVENKGRTPVRMIELCIEKFAGTTLPESPVYSHAHPWGLVLEKGPIWIRGTEEQIVVTAADCDAANAAYQAAGAFWVFGYFAYPNLLNERIEHKFLTRWDLEVGFVPENRVGYT